MNGTNFDLATYLTAVLAEMTADLEAVNGYLEGYFRVGLDPSDRLLREANEISNLNEDLEDAIDDLLPGDGPGEYSDHRLISVRVLQGARYLLERVLLEDLGVTRDAFEFSGFEAGSTEWRIVFWADDLDVSAVENAVWERNGGGWVVVSELSDDPPECDDA